MLQSIIDFLRGFPWERTFWSVRSIFVILDILLVFFFVYLFARALKFRPKFYFNPAKLAKQQKKIKEKAWVAHWNHVMEKARKNPPQSFFLAIIETDSLVDTILKKLGVPGEHMADRLERLANWNLKTIERLWRAHKIRNDLAHTPGFTLDPHDAEQVLGDYEAFLKEIGAI